MGLFCKVFYAAFVHSKYQCVNGEDGGGSGLKGGCGLAV